MLHFNVETVEVTIALHTSAARTTVHLSQGRHISKMLFHLLLHCVKDCVADQFCCDQVLEYYLMYIYIC